MIRVSLHEWPRVFDVFVGNKKVGEIKSWGNHVDAYRLNHDGSMTYVGSEKSLRRGMQSILCEVGFGKSGPGYRVKTRSIT